MLNRLPLLTILTVACLQAVTIRDFDANSGSPSSQGWARESGILSGATATDLGQYAWQMTGNYCCGYWSNALTNAEWTDAFNVGWSLRGIVRTTGTTETGYIFLDVPLATGRPRFDIDFRNDGVNGWAGLGVFFGAANPAPKATISGNGYHLLDMKWDATSPSASLWVDGTLALSGHTGHNQFRETHGPAFGVSSLTTQGLFQKVQFSISYPTGPDPGPKPVPEPASIALVGAAQLFAARHKLEARKHSRKPSAGTGEWGASASRPSPAALPLQP